MSTTKKKPEARKARTPMAEAYQQASSLWLNTQYICPDICVLL